jgi:hypothetical protein
VPESEILTYNKASDVHFVDKEITVELIRFPAGKLWADREHHYLVYRIFCQQVQFFFDGSQHPLHLFYRPAKRHYRGFQLFPPGKREQFFYQVLVAKVYAVESTNGDSRLFVSFHL